MQRHRRATAQRAFQRHGNRLGEAADLGCQRHVRHRTDTVGLADPRRRNREQTFRPHLHLSRIGVDTHDV